MAKELHIDSWRNVSMNDVLFGVRLGGKCPHCGTTLDVLFKKNMTTGELLSAVKHDFMVGEWQPVTGFDDVSQLEAGKEIYDGYFG